MRPTGQVMNIVRVYHQATAAEVMAGLTWYRDMGDLAVKRMKAVNRQHQCGYDLTPNGATGW